ncbi:hypothetical protein COMNV_01080 [Commensalibacter sp. Nvir]|uniref:helix-turn-helix transcriptional regulator n=1 Tax=Commensalibacter sp. Nvir TaxID=3069817 RepID=UPI002D4CBA61|nr:hypothetical protein COMNV_01080 [Commensalibacter sp. Nvir]
MSKKEVTPTIGENLKRYRKRMGLSQTELAKLVKEMTDGRCSQQTIGNIETGKIQESKLLPYIAFILGVKLSALNPIIKENTDLLAVEERISPLLRSSVKNVSSNFFQSSFIDNLAPLRDEIPIYETLGMAQEGFHITDTPVEYMPRPHVVKLEKNAFGITIGIRNLEPALRIGDVIIVHPRKIVKPTKLCLLVNNSGERNVYNLGEFVDENPLNWIIKQYNPFEKKILSKSDWQKCYAIVAKFF